ncbi:hypothetical protein DFA_02617 [Cavenderia fasciculata]|uniref:Uncharacterized protein n=1 Tax=Cavenderia fasciculata TaxID=261658 RepID=F4PZW4_CACFS|nr:uncharacterized protein DFA_02617 [Cavenderia fasciculata]EGG18878.1 hypothetical protein DFA_02617 [Cavenderia fasciculata]|eukprot:XP_004357340.1 hypothetical protein DFA_02617 [Cavenderia fasciculata]
MNNYINNNGPLTFNNYEDLKNLFYQLLRENQNPRAVKVVAQKSGKHITNITVHPHYTVSHVFQNIIPQAIPELLGNQNYEIFWQDQRGDASVFFLKDMDLPLFNYLQSSDSIIISTLTPNDVNKKPFFFQIIQQGKKAIIIPNQK